MTAPPRWFGSAAVLILFALAGCNKQARPTLMANMAKEEITVSQLRAVNYVYAARFGHAVAARTHEIILATEDRDVVMRGNVPFTTSPQKRQSSTTGETALRSSRPH